MYEQYKCISLATCLVKLDCLVLKKILFYSKILFNNSGDRFTWYLFNTHNKLNKVCVTVFNRLRFFILKLKKVSLLPSG